MQVSRKKKKVGLVKAQEPQEILNQQKDLLAKLGVDVEWDKTKTLEENYIRNGCASCTATQRPTAGACRCRKVAEQEQDELPFSPLVVHLASAVPVAAYAGLSCLRASYTGSTSAFATGVRTDTPNARRLAKDLNSKFGRQSFYKKKEAEAHTVAQVTWFAFCISAARTRTVSGRVSGPFGAEKGLW